MYKHKIFIPQSLNYISDVEVSKGITLETKPLVDNEMVETQKSNDSDKTVGSGSVSL